MPEEAVATETAVEETPDVQGEPELQDAGKNAIAAERRARAAAEKNAKALKARLDEIEAAQLSKEELAAKEAADAKAEAIAAKAEALRWKVAATYGITQEDAELFLTATDEETLTRQAERLRERTPTQPPKGTHVPGVGQKPGLPPSPNEQIAAAEAEGNFSEALALKAQVIADLARHR